MSLFVGRGKSVTGKTLLILVVTLFVVGVLIGSVYVAAGGAGSDRESPVVSVPGGTCCRV